jgi:hypothetical protein
LPKFKRFLQGHFETHAVYWIRDARRSWTIAGTGDEQP